VKRILMYSQDGLGLGHLRRSSNIADEILSRDPDCDVVILADSPSVSLMPPRRGLEIMKLPTIIKTGSESWKSTNWKTATLSSNIRRMVRLRANLILEAYKDFRPHAVLVDHMPVGALGELKPMLERAARKPRRAKLYLGLRDILDDPHVIRRAWKKLGGYEYLSFYDAVLIYGNQAIHDSTEAYGLLPDAREVIYCGYVSPSHTSRTLVSKRQDPFLLMMGGGGNDAFRLASAFATASNSVLREFPGLSSVVLTGPNMSRAEVDKLRGLAPSTMRIESGIARAESWIQESAAIVTLAGYNSVCEVLKWHKKALVVPRAGPSAEQLTRSGLLSARSLIRMIDPRTLSPKRLARELISLLRDDAIPNIANIPRLDGAQRAATLLVPRAS
jgi:predicted glycosyltransferase